MRTIQSPGVEISEIDLSLRPALPTGTNVIIPGFSQKGPTEEVIEITTLSEFEQVYGTPTNAAERYFYHTVKAIKTSPANCFVYRLPYGAGRGDEADGYSALCYPVIALSGEQFNATAAHASFYTPTVTSAAFSGAGKEVSTPSNLVANPTLSGQSDTESSVPWKAGVTYYIGEPQNFNISRQEYDDFKQGNYTWAEKSFSATGDQTPFNSFADAVTGGAGLVIVNSRKNIINEKFEGFYVGLIDNTNLNPATEFDGCLSVNTVTTKLTGSNSTGGGTHAVDRYLSIPSARLNFALSGTNRATKLNDGQTGSTHSVSEVLENLSDIELGTEEFDDTLAIGLFKIRQSVLAADTTKLDYILAESYVGSLNGFKKANSPTGGTPQSHFIEDVAEARPGTPNIEIMVNPNISLNQGDWFDHELGVSKKKVRVCSSSLQGVVSADEGLYLNELEQAALSGHRAKLQSGTVKIQEANALYPSGVFKDTSVREILVGAIPSKLERMFEVVDNYELYPLDISVEAGLGTIYVGTSGGRTAGFDDEKAWPIDGSTVGDNKCDDLYQTKIVSNFNEGGGSQGPSSVLNYRFVNDAFINFAENKRKDLIHISDNLRYIFVQGRNSKVLDQEFKETDAQGNEVTTKKYFSKHVYWPLRHIQGNANTSYSCAFGNWVKTFDGTLNRGMWVPFSGFAAGLFGNTDADFQPWYAPAGFTRGILQNVSDLAIYPKVKERDQLYKINQNPVANFPNDGFVVFGQKTLQKKPSAFDRINVRRLFLYLEKATRATVKYFVFEPNTLFTRTQVVNVLTPIFENAKNTDGMYDYMIVCDERNNTPDVIDQNEMVIDIYIKPVRAAEFILVNFYATRTGQDFNELVG